jgi:hypothetical protein
VAKIDFPLAVYDLGNNALSSYLGKVALLESVLFHQEFQHVCARYVWAWTVLIIVVANQRAQCCNKIGQRVLFVSSRSIQQLIHCRNGGILFSMCANRMQGHLLLDSRKVLGELSELGVHCYALH